jgi:hypothetical protein
MDSSGAAASGVIFMCLFWVGPCALVLHFVVRRYLVAALTVSGALALFLTSVWLYYMFFDRHQAPKGTYIVELEILGLGCLLSFMVSGLPALLFRFFRRRREQY